MLNAVLDELVAGIQAALGDAFVGAYLQGSFALGDSDRHSDVDFVVAVRDELSDHQVIALQALHERIYDLPSEWAQHLEGSYFPTAILRDLRRRGTPLWYLDHGSRSLVRSDHCNTLSTRPDPARASREPPDPADFESTLGFVKAVMRESERYAPSRPG
jgi:Nucleotidyltransferase domain